ncbi:unnamed protein product [Cuscuta campestris]|uniref:Uncharacterized protein n=1 Tax=Cuscuta campestris TaxID=132261 RepID=A0A484K456_9ASTE|nr:unnamed protein product [Cuscuta campestris]
MSCKKNWVWIIFLVGLVVLNYGCFSEARRHNPSEAVLVGTVYCNTCQHFSKPSPSISGASIAVECGSSEKCPRFGKEVKTDRNGEFKVKLPFSVIKLAKKTKGFCSVKLISSSDEPFCAGTASSPATSTSSIHLIETKQGKQIFSAGSFAVKPDACNRTRKGKKTGTPKSQKPETSQENGISHKKSKYLSPDDTSFAPPIQDAPPRGLLLPPVTQGGVSLPLPEIPPIPKIPFLPGVPGFPTVPKKTENLDKTARESQSGDEKTAQPGIFAPVIGGGLPPNPLLPPPSQLPVNPFLPPSSITPPVPSLQQPFPFLPSPSLPTPLPQFPFQPTPTFPGVPPAAAASFTQKKSSP